jgi:cell division septum initiation protein DivIVA
MSTDRIQEAIRKLRDVELRRAVHGVDTTQVRDLLAEAADTLASAARDQAELRDELERLAAANDESAIGKALLAATRAGEDLMAEAREKAASLSIEAKAQASALLEQAKAQAARREQETRAAWEQFEREITDAKQAHAKELEASRADVEAALADARRELVQLENKAAQVRSLVADMQHRIVGTAREALQQLEAFGASPSGTAESDLLADLRPAAELSDVRPIEEPSQRRPELSGS